VDSPLLLSYELSSLLDTYEVLCVYIHILHTCLWAPSVCCSCVLFVVLLAIHATDSVCFSNCVCTFTLPVCGLSYFAELGLASQLNYKCKNMSFDGVFCCCFKTFFVFLVVFTVNI